MLTSLEVDELDEKIQDAQDLINDYRRFGYEELLIISNKVLNDCRKILKENDKRYCKPKKKKRRK